MGQIKQCVSLTKLGYSFLSLKLLLMEMYLLLLLFTFVNKQQAKHIIPVLYLLFQYLKTLLLWNMI